MIQLKYLTSKTILWTLPALLLLISPAIGAVEQCKELKVAFAQDWFPVSFIETTKEKKVRGVAVDIISAIADDNNIALKVVNPISWKQANQKMDDGDIDVLAGHFWSEHRNNNWHISKPLFNSDIRVFYLSNKKKLEQINDLIGLTGMRPAGATYGDELDEFIANKLSVSEMRNNTTMVLSLYKQQADFAIMERLDGLAHIFRLGLQEKVAISEFSLSELTVHFSFSKRSPCENLYAVFNQNVDKYISEQQIKVMTNKASSHYFHMP